MPKSILNGALGPRLASKRQPERRSKNRVEQTLEKTRNIIKSWLQNDRPKSDSLVLFRGLGLRAPQAGPKDPLGQPPRLIFNKTSDKIDPKIVFR